VRDGERKKERKKEREAVIDCETWAGSRHVGTPGRLIIWSPLKPLFFKLFRPKTGLARAKRADKKFFRLWNPYLLALKSVIIPVTA
jgi:hypothetical protein